MTCMPKVTSHDVSGGMPAFISTRQQLFSKAHPDLVWFPEAVKAVWEWCVLSWNLQTFLKSHERVMFSHSLWSILKSHKNRVCFPAVFKCWRGCVRAFSKDVSVLKVLCDPQRPLNRKRIPSKGKGHVADLGKFLVTGAIAPFPKAHTSWVTVVALQWKLRPRSRGSLGATAEYHYSWTDQWSH